MHAADGVSESQRHLEESFGCAEFKRLSGEAWTSERKYDGHSITGTEG
jgi:hypothetical protein